MPEAQGTTNLTTRCHRQAEGRWSHLIYMIRWCTGEREQGQGGKTWEEAEHLPHDDSEWRPNRSGSHQMIVLIRSDAFICPSEIHLFYVSVHLSDQIFFFSNARFPLIFKSNSASGTWQRNQNGEQGASDSSYLLLPDKTSRLLFMIPSIIWSLQKKLMIEILWSILWMRKLPQLHHTRVRFSRPRKHRKVVINVLQGVI